MKNKQTVSGLSTAINQTMVSYQNNTPLIEKKKTSNFIIKVANTLEERQAAFELAYRVYLEKGFVNDNPNEWLVQSYDSNNETVILIVQDQEKNIAGTITLVFDGESKLPAEKIYSEELKVLRNSGTNMAELSRLAISPSYRNSKEILVMLFNYATIYIRQVKGYNSLSIQVNPRHKNYYKALMNFEEVGSEKPCPQVQNAPAVLLYITESKYQQEMNRIKNLKSSHKKDYSLFQYFINAEQENLVAYYLEKQVKPMTSEEKTYFGFTTSDIGQAVAV